MSPQPPPPIRLQEEAAALLHEFTLRGVAEACGKAAHLESPHRHALYELCAPGTTKVCTVFVAIAAELRLLANCDKTGRLSPAQFRAMAAASEQAGRVCAARGHYNSVGVTPRSIFESRKIPRAHVCEALRVVKANPPACADALSRAWTEYLFYSLHDRYSPHELYSTDGTEAGFKAGDSGNENVWRDGQFDPATRRRYGGRFHDLIRNS